MNNKKDHEWGSLFGMTCDGRDVIANHLMVPNNLEIGDWLSMGGMGSYTFGPRYLISKLFFLNSGLSSMEWNQQQKFVNGQENCNKI